MDRAFRKHGAAKAVKQHPSVVESKNGDLRVFRRGTWCYIDLRAIGGSAKVMRDPSTPGWPERGERTSNLRVAGKWADKYFEHYVRMHHLEEGHYNTLDEAYHAWISHREVQSQASTVSAGRTAMKTLMEFAGASTHPAEITAKWLQRMWDDLLREGYKTSTVQTHRQQISMFYHWLGIGVNPARETKLPKTANPDKVAWTPEQQERIRDAADRLDEARSGGVFFRVLVEMLFATGMRIQEAAAARYEWFNVDDRTVRISSQIARKGHSEKPVKAGDPRTTVVLQEWWSYHEGGKIGLVLQTSTGAPIPYRTLYGYVREILEHAAVKKSGEAAHHFRHTYAYYFLRRGGVMWQLQHSLGHKSIRTTEKYYKHFTTEAVAALGVRAIYGAESTVRRGPRTKRCERQGRVALPLAFSQIAVNTQCVA